MCTKAIGNPICCQKKGNATNMYHAINKGISGKSEIDRKSKHKKKKIEVKCLKKPRHFQTHHKQHKHDIPNFIIYNLAHHRCRLHILIHSCSGLLPHFYFN